MIKKCCLYLFSFLRYGIIQNMKFSKTLITCEIVNINLLLFPPLFLSPYASSGVEYVNWICSFMLLAVQKPGKRKRCTFRPLSVKAMPCNWWKSCLHKGRPTGPKSPQ